MAQLVPCCPDTVSVCQDLVDGCLDGRSLCFWGSVGGKDSGAGTKETGVFCRASRAQEEYFTYHAPRPRSSPPPQQVPEMSSAVSGRLSRRPTGSISYVLEAIARSMKIAVASSGATFEKTASVIDPAPSNHRDASTSRVHLLECLAGRAGWSECPRALDMGATGTKPEVPVLVSRAMFDIRERFPGLMPALLIVSLRLLLAAVGGGAAAAALDPLAAGCSRSARRQCLMGDGLSAAHQDVIRNVSLPQQKDKVQIKPTSKTHYG